MRSIRRTLRFDDTRTQCEKCINHLTLVETLIKLKCYKSTAIKGSYALHEIDRCIDVVNDNFFYDVDDNIDYHADMVLKMRKIRTIIAEKIGDLK